MLLKPQLFLKTLPLKEQLLPNNNNISIYLSNLPVPKYLHETTRAIVTHTKGPLLLEIHDFTMHFYAEHDIIPPLLIVHLFFSKQLHEHFLLQPVEHI